MDNNKEKVNHNIQSLLQNVKDIYLSDGSMATLLDFERVLDELDMYAFKYWSLGELVKGPEIKKYLVQCAFMWPENLMPDPRGAKRLIPFDCKVTYEKTKMKVPVSIKTPEDFRDGVKKPKLIEKMVWIVTITMPKSLMDDIRTGSLELENQTIDLGELDDAYQDDLDQDQNTDDNNQEEQTDEEENYEQ
jgi:hypothetical protein